MAKATTAPPSSARRISPATLYFFGALGGILFSPIQDFGTQVLSLKRNTNIGALFGGGLAYEISPSFAIRAEYRGFLLKAPDFGAAGGIFKTNRYEVLSMPAIGVAYHF